MYNLTVLSMSSLSPNGRLSSPSVVYINIILFSMSLQTVIRSFKQQPPGQLPDLVPHHSGMALGITMEQRNSDSISAEAP